MQLKQKVNLTVFDQIEGGSVVLDATGLRVDFDIRNIPEFSRATFTLYNLTDRTISALMSGTNYVTVTVQLQDGPVQTLANRMKINNVVDELKLPERVVTLFCFDNIRSEVLEKSVDIVVPNPSLRNMVSGMLSTVGYQDNPEYIHFPKGRIDEPGLKNDRPVQGTVQQCLRRLESEYGFETYTHNSQLKFIYKPDKDNIESTDVPSKEADVKLSTRAMKSNPKIGIATATIDSNLDGRIGPGSLLDMSELFTIAVDANERSLQLNENYLKNLTGFSKYTAFNVTHAGSTHTALWSTRVTALSPTQGTVMPSVMWASRTY